MLWLAIHFSDLPLEIFAAGQHGTRRALVVLQDQRVCFCNAAAAECGIVPGATLATAHSIQPELLYRHRDLEAELRRLHTLADTLYRFSNYVSVQAPDCVLLEISGSLKLFRSHAVLTRQAIGLCRELGHAGSARVAQTPWAAIALARTKSRQLQDVPLAGAGLELAGVPHKVVERFAQMGIYTLGPLLNLPAASLGRRFGKPLLRYLAQLTADMPDPRKAVTPAQSFRRSLHLLSPIRNRIDLHEHDPSPMNKLLRELQHWLVAHQLGCRSLRWSFVSHHAENVHVMVRFAGSKQNAADIMGLSVLKLTRVDLPEEILTTELQALDLQPWTGGSSMLFPLGGVAGEAAGPSDLIDEINARLGEGRCRTLQAIDQHAPESTWQDAAALQAGHVPVAPACQDVDPESPCPLQPGRRPLWLFDPPHRISSEELELLQGPERIQSQWWQDGAVCRDYYIARHRSGAECWAFVDQHAAWYLHGYFG